jgi:predicted transcriptional regulator of viral defense system
MPRATPHLDAVVASLRAHGECRVRDVAQDVQSSQAQVQDTLNRLLIKGEAQRVRRGVYRLAGPPAKEGNSDERLAGSSAMEEDSIILPRPLADTGLPQANPFLLQEALSALTRWRAAYSGPADDPTAVSVVMASMHVQEALGVPYDDLG